MARISLKGLHKVINEAKATNNNNPVELMFLNSLKASILKEEESKQRLPSKSYKPSSMNCMRNMYYQRTGMGEGKLVKQTSPNLVGIGESGTDRHDRMQRHIIEMKKNGFDVEYIDVEDYIRDNDIQDIEIRGKRGVETKLWHKTLFMSFMTDGILKINGEYYVFEFKTEIEGKFNYRSETDPKHYNQATAYSIAFGIDKVLFLYENRNNLELKAYVLDVTSGMVREVREKIETVEECVKEGVLPPKTTLKRNCYYCPYKEICKYDYNIMPEPKEEEEDTDDEYIDELDD